MPESSVKILQLTDTHLFADPQESFDGMNTFESLNLVINLARHNHWPPEAILLTGDLVHEPVAVAEAYTLLRRVLTDIKVPVYCIPGNHDDPALMQEILPYQNITLIKQIFFKDWQVILLNTHISNSHAGRLAPSELEFLDCCLQSHPGRPTLIGLHHPPVSIDSSWMDAMALQNPQDLFAILDRYSEVRCLLWGHIHQQFETQRNDIRLLSSPSTCIQFKPQTDRYIRDELEAGYRWLVLHEDGRIDTGINRIPV